MINLKIGYVRLGNLETGKGSVEIIYIGNEIINKTVGLSRGAFRPDFDTLLWCRGDGCKCTPCILNPVFLNQYTCTASIDLYSNIGVV